MGADTTTAPRAGAGTAADEPSAARVRYLFDVAAGGSGSGGALSLLFPVFLLLAAFVATLAAGRSTQPRAETAVLASLAERFAPVRATVVEAADQEEGKLLSALERLRSRLERDAEIDETNPTLADDAWTVTMSAGRFFLDGTDQPRPERRVLLYRLAQAAAELAPEGATLEITAGSWLPNTSAPARLAEICRRLIDLGAPETALRLRPRRDGSDVVTLALTGVAGLP